MDIMKKLDTNVKRSLIRCFDLQVDEHRQSMYMPIQLV